MPCSVTTKLKWFCPGDESGHFAEPDMNWAMNKL